MVVTRQATATEMAVMVAEAMVSIKHPDAVLSFADSTVGVTFTGNT